MCTIFTFLFGVLVGALSIIGWAFYHYFNVWKKKQEEQKANEQNNA